MRLEYHTSLDDMALVQYALLCDLGQDKVFRNRLWKAAGWFLVAALVALLFINESPDGWVLPAVMFGCVVWLVISGFRTQPKLMAESRRLAAKVLDGEDWLPFALTLDESGAMSETPTVDIRHHWSSFTRLDESSTHLLLHFKQGGVVGVPLRLFDDRYKKREVIDTINRLVAEHGGDRHDDDQAAPR